MTDIKITTPSIDPVQNGPYKVSGNIDLRDSDGWQVTQDDEFLLCRCGNSSNKPFCDGSHKQNKFSSARQFDPVQEELRDYPNNSRSLIIHDNRSVCAQSGNCVKHAKSIFVPGSEPWIKPTGEIPGKVIKAVEKCPSGALSYTFDGKVQVIEERPPKIQIVRNGPYLVEGGPALLGTATPQTREHYALCRCGASKNKPFCDGSHLTAPLMDKLDRDPSRVTNPSLRSSYRKFALPMFAFTFVLLAWVEGLQPGANQGIFGSAPLLADISLILNVILLAGLTFGYTLAKRGDIAAHKYNQTMWVLFNAILIVFIVVPSLSESALQGATASRFWLTWANAAAGILAAGGGVYLLLLMNQRLPAALRITWWKKLMRMVLTAYWLVALLGFVTYIFLYLL